MALSNVFLTGVGGFIGYHLAAHLLRKGVTVIGIDSLNHYYDPSLKKNRIQRLQKEKKFRFIPLDLAHRHRLHQIFLRHAPYDAIIHLAAQAGVRYALKHPYSYQKNNLQAFLHLLEVCQKESPNTPLLYASSSSVYGASSRLPFCEKDPCNQPLSVYGAMKKSNEMLAHTYAHLYGLPLIGLRLFTVYGPWGRPDMALFIFTERMIQGKTVKVFNEGDMWRDFTYIDDVIEAIYLLLCTPFSTLMRTWKASSSISPAVLNIGGGKSAPLMRFIRYIEASLQRRGLISFAKLSYHPMQKGDVRRTHADTSLLRALTNFTPKIQIKEGVERFIDWYVSYYK